MTIATEFASEAHIDRGNISESYLRALDLIGILLSAIMTLGPLAATAAFN